VGRSGLGTYSGVLIPTCENMWGKILAAQIERILEV
jgi:hypothetical protein